MHLESGFLPFLLRDAEQCLRRSNKRFQMPPPLDHMFNKCRRPHGDEREPAPLSFIAVVHTCVSPGRRCQTCTLAVVFCRRRCSFSCLPVKRQHPLIYVCVCVRLCARTRLICGWVAVCVSSVLQEHLPRFIDSNINNLSVPVCNNRTNTPREGSSSTLKS